MSGRVEILIIEAPTPCEQCRKAKEIANALAQKYEGVSVRVINVLDPEADKFGVVMTPTVVVNGVIISVRRAPNSEKLEEFVKSQLGGVAQ